MNATELLVVGFIFGALFILAVLAVLAAVSGGRVEAAVADAVQSDTPIHDRLAAERWTCRDDAELAELLGGQR